MNARFSSESVELRCGFVVLVLPYTGSEPGATVEPPSAASVLPEMPVAATVESRAKIMRLTDDADASSPPM